VAVGMLLIALVGILGGLYAHKAEIITQATEYTDKAVDAERKSLQRYLDTEFKNIADRLDKIEDKL
jgi:hypothetical protein